MVCHSALEFDPHHVFCGKAETNVHEMDFTCTFCVF